EGPERAEERRLSHTFWYVRASRRGALPSLTTTSALTFPLLVPGDDMPAKYIQLGAEAPAPSTMQTDERQVKNSAGGFVFEVSPEQRLRRFLVLGTEGGTFYVGERELTKASALFLKRYAQQDPGEMFRILSEVDRENVAPRHTNLLYAFAILYAETSGSD